MVYYKDATTNYTAAKEFDSDDSNNANFDYQVLFMDSIGAHGIALVKNSANTDEISLIRFSVDLSTNSIPITLKPFKLGDGFYNQ